MRAGEQTLLSYCGTHGVSMSAMGTPCRIDVLLFSIPERRLPAGASLRWRTRSREGAGRPSGRRSYLARLISRKLSAILFNGCHDIRFKLGVFHIELPQVMQNHLSDQEPHISLIVRRNHVPGRFGSGGLVDAEFVIPHVLIPTSSRFKVAR